MQGNEAIFILKLNINAVQPTLDYSEPGYIVHRLALSSCIIVQFLFVFLFCCFIVHVKKKQLKCKLGH